MDIDDLFDDDRYEDFNLEDCRDNECIEPDRSVADDALEQEKHLEPFEEEINSFIRQVNEIGSLIKMEQLELEQPLISKKDIYNAYSVERNYINSKAYHDKFEKLPVNKDVQQILYN